MSLFPGSPLPGVSPGTERMTGRRGRGREKGRERPGRKQGNVGAGRPRGRKTAFPAAAGLSRQKKFEMAEEQQGENKSMREKSGGYNLPIKKMKKWS